MQGQSSGSRPKSEREAEAGAPVLDLMEPMGCPRVSKSTFYPLHFNPLIMATNTGKEHRKGSVKDRTQVENPNDDWTKRDAESGEFMDQKADDKPFKGVAKEPDDRRTSQD